MEDFDHLLSKVNLDELCCHTSTNKPLPATSAPPCFAAPKSNKELEEARQNAKSKNMVKSSNWAVNIWKEWTTYRCEICDPMDSPPHLVICTDYQLDYWISKFILEVRRVDGQTYPPNSLYSICCGLMRFIREVKPEINLFKDPQFSGLQTNLDSEMKRLCSQGVHVGVKRKRAEPISIEEEEILWEKGLLSEDSPKDTMIYLCGVLFALRSGQEHEVYKEFR